MITFVVLTLRQLSMALVTLALVTAPALAADKDKDARPLLGVTAPTAFATVKDTDSEWNIISAPDNARAYQCTTTRAQSLAVGQPKITFALTREKKDTENILQIFMVSILPPEKNVITIAVGGKKIAWEAQHGNVSHSASAQIDDIKNFSAAIRKDKQADFTLGDAKITLTSDLVVDLLDKLTDCVASKAKGQNNIK